MRTTLFWTLALLLPQLAAQELPPRPLSPTTTQPTTPASTPELAAVPAAASQARLASDLANQVRFDRPRADGPLWALGRAWKASFDQTGTTVVPFFGTSAPRNFPLHLELTRATVGGHSLPLQAGEPQVTGTTVRTNRGALSEVIETGMESLEQSFVFDTLPSRAAIAVEVAVLGEFSPVAIENGVRFANDFGHIDYTKAVAVDARGEQLPLDIVWTGSSVRMEIPAAFVERAQLPIVLDPVLNFWFLLASGQTQLQHDSDVASFQGLGGRTLLVWQRQWSANDQDCYGLMFDGNLGLVQTDFLIDVTTEDWTKVAVASNNYAQNFLVVAETRIGMLFGSLYYIGGRGVAANASVGGVFDIERDGVVGSGGYNYHPDVGGDPYYGVGRYTVVFSKVGGPASGIYMKQVTTAGGLVTTAPIALDTNAAIQSRPSIGKSCGQSNGLSAYWFVTWERTYSASDQDIYGRFVNWNGAVPVGSFAVSTAFSNETAPSPGAPIDAEGVRYWPMCFENASSPGQPRDIHCRLFRNNGSFQASFTVNTNVPGVDERDPEMDSDGTRLLTCYTGQSSSGNPSEEVVLTAYLPATNTFRTDFRGGLQTSSLDTNTQMNVHADFSGGGTTSPRYFISFTNENTNTFELVNFGGWLTGNLFTSRSSQCGNLSIGVSGLPVVGQTVTFTVGTAPFSGTILGVPGFIPLNVLGCNCWQGVDQGIYLGNPLVWTVPNNPAYVGITLSVQGWNIVGNQCLGFVDLSDTIDFTIR